MFDKIKEDVRELMTGSNVENDMRARLHADHDDVARIMSELENMCSKDNVDELVSSLLKKFDIVTGLSTWSDPKHTH